MCWSMRELPLRCSLEMRKLLLPLAGGWANTPPRLHKVLPQSGTPPHCAQCR